MKKKIFLGRAAEQEAEESRRGGIRFITKSHEPPVEEPRRRAPWLAPKADDRRVQEQYNGGIRFPPRSKPSPTPAYLTPPAAPARGSARRPQTSAQTYSSGGQRTESSKPVIAIVTVLLLFVLMLIIFVAGRARTVAYTPRPRVAAPSEPARQPERMWMKEYMQQQGPSEELKARRARMSQFQYTGSATGDR